MSEVSGFDMTPTLRWYWQNLAAVAKNLSALVTSIHGSHVDTPCFRSIVMHDGSPVDPVDAASFVACTRLLPPQARARSCLRSVVIRPPKWFHRDSVGERPIDTKNVDYALSPGAVIPSYTGYAEWEEGEPHGEKFDYYANIDMYEILGIGLPVELLDPMGKLRPALRRIVWSQAFLREVGHTIVTPILFGGTGKRNLRLPDGRVVDQYEFLMEAIPIVRGLPPISHYASTYSESDGSLKLARGTIHTALGEHLAEAIAARYLGFAYQPNGNGLEPFDGRWPLQDFVEAFMDAEWVD